MRRGEICGPALLLHRSGREVIDLRRNWVLGVKKDTKTHQNRRIALDAETVTLLREHHERVEHRLANLGVLFAEDRFVFTPDVGVLRILQGNQPPKPILSNRDNTQLELEHIAQILTQE